MLQNNLDNFPARQLMNDDSDTIIDTTATHCANLVQNCVKYLRAEYRLSRTTGKLLLR